MSVFTNQIDDLNRLADEMEADFQEAYERAIDKLRDNHSTLEIEVWEDGCYVNNVEDEEKDAVEHSLQTELIFLIEEELGIK